EGGFNRSPRGMLRALNLNGGSVFGAVGTINCEARIVNQKLFKLVPAIERNHQHNGGNHHSDRDLQTRDGVRPRIRDAGARTRWRSVGCHALLLRRVKISLEACDPLPAPSVTMASPGFAAAITAAMPCSTEPA